MDFVAGCLRWCKGASWEWHDRSEQVAVARRPYRLGDAQYGGRVDVGGGSAWVRRRGETILMAVGWRSVTAVRR